MTFERACAASDVVLNKPLAVTVSGVDIAVISTVEGWFAILDECSHGAVPLADGEVEDCHLECPLHGSRFDLRTGRPDQLPATRPVSIYPVSIVGDDVLVDVANPYHVEEN